MNSPEIIAERAAEKRRLSPNYQPSLAELKAVDAVLIAQAREAMQSVTSHGQITESKVAVFVVELTEAQLLNAWMQAYRDLGETLEGVKRGRGVEADAVVKRSLYQALSKVVYARLPQVPQAVKGGAE